MNIQRELFSLWGVHVGFELFRSDKADIWIFEPYVVWKRS